MEEAGLAEALKKLPYWFARMNDDQLELLLRRNVRIKITECNGRTFNIDHELQLLNEYIRSFSKRNNLDFHKSGSIDAKCLGSATKAKQNLFFGLLFLK